MFFVSNASGRRRADDDFWFGPLPAGGASPDGQAALRLTTAWGCIRVKAETLGQLPCILYRRLPQGGKVRAVEHPLYHLVGRRPNGQQTSYEWRSMTQGHVETRGNAYSFRDYGGGSQLRALVPLHPDRTTPELLDSGRMRYRYRDRNGVERVFVQDEILHIRGFVSDGYIGMNPVEVHRQTIGGAMEAERFNARFLQSDARPPGWIEHPSHFKDDEAYENFRRKFSVALTGDRRHAPILEYGMKYHEVGMKLADAQFLESRKYNGLQICQIWRMPPHKVQILDQAKWANIEQQSIDFVTDTMLPTLTSWEQRLNEDLLTEEEQQWYFFEFLIDGLMRGDSAARAAYYEKALKNRWMVPNEVRERDNLNPTDWGDDPLPLPNQSLRSERSEEMESRNAAVVVGKEMNSLRTLGNRCEGDALVAAVTDFYRAELPQVVSRVMVVGDEDAARYCEDSLARVMDAVKAGALPALLSTFKAQRAGQMLEIINGE